ncbi:MAG: hypothetical protein HRT94_00255 [Alphaproteobacteria bacterium]|nr:hypothetical protein [Alphaproteobacteria bacterium]
MTDITLHSRFRVPSPSVKTGDRLTVMTFAGQNTNGEDLKCAVMNTYRGGGISCNWQDAIRPEATESIAAPAGGTAEHKAMPTP